MVVYLSHDLSEVTATDYIPKHYMSISINIIKFILNISHIHSCVAKMWMNPKRKRSEKVLTTVANFSTVHIGKTDQNEYITDM